MPTKYKASVVIPILNNTEMTAKAILTMKEHTELPFEVVIVDNASPDMATAIFKYIKDVTYLRMEENLGFVKAVNEGIKAAKGEHIIVANNDILVTNRWLDKMVETAESSPDVGVVGLLTTDGGERQSIYNDKLYKIERSFIKPENTNLINLRLEESKQPNEVEEPNSIIFCLALIKRSVIDKVGLLGEEFGVGFGDDGDYCIRARDAGFKLMVRTDGFFYHYRRTTFRQVYPVEKILEMQQNNINILIQKHPKHYHMITKKIRSDKPLNILVTNNHLRVPGGSETWTYTMAKTLIDMGHKVEVYTNAPGDLSKRISEFAPVDVRIKKDYDLYLVNHKPCMEEVLKHKGFKIMTCHGIYPTLEQPISGADAYVSVSEEVQTHLKNLNIPSTIIRNGIDCERFSPKREIAPKLTRVLSMCQGTVARDMLAKVCAEMGIQFDYVGIEKRVWNIEEYIDKADLVVALGRSAYEAMAMGREVLVYDTRGYSPLKTADGLVRSENMNDLLFNNLSGRRFKINMTPELLKTELLKYDPEQGKKNRQYIFDNMSIERQVIKYLGLYYDSLRKK